MAVALAKTTRCAYSILPFFQKWRWCRSLKMTLRTVQLPQAPKEILAVQYTHCQDCKMPCRTCWAAGMVEYSVASSFQYHSFVRRRLNQKQTGLLRAAFLGGQTSRHAIHDWRRNWCASGAAKVYATRGTKFGKTYQIYAIYRLPLLGWTLREVRMTLSFRTWVLKGSGL
jgi:hypothetical protein